MPNESTNMYISPKLSDKLKQEAHRLLDKLTKLHGMI